MSEMKEINLNSMGCYNINEPVYLKSEADNVIAEKDSEIARLNAIRKVHVEAIESMGAGLLQDDKEIRHQKYKRCLAMARWCAKNVDHLNSEGYIYEKQGCTDELDDCIKGTEFYHKWYNYWSKLAEKFKPNSTAQ